ncbi:MAG TPA: hypothetical protein VE987_18490 [Polyangiaceae bacterium]|nr:hypothetical protein [Polyangiaceae bacterium]
MVGTRHWRYRANSSWSIDSSPDVVVWTDVNALRRARLARWRWLVLGVAFGLVAIGLLAWAAAGR